jgi:hypothetical protein
MRFLKAIAILIFGPLFGILVAFILVGLALPSDPNFVANGGHAAPGDGFLVQLYLFICLLAFVPTSIVAARFCSARPRLKTNVRFLEWAQVPRSSKGSFDCV